MAVFPGQFVSPLISTPAIFNFGISGHLSRAALLLASLALSAAIIIVINKGQCVFVCG